MTYYHFVGTTLRDRRPVPPDGAWLEHDGPVVLCKSGLHASLTPWEALTYAPGPILCEVEVDGMIVRDHDKIVASRRMIRRRVDLTEVLRAFARDEARRVLHLWDAPAVVRTYLETGDESIRAAVRDAAWGAARAAAEAAARDAAWAVWDAAEAAAEAAARDAARDAAWAARDAAGARFNALALAALERAA